MVSLYALMASSSRREALRNRWISLFRRRASMNRAYACRRACASGVSCCWPELAVEGVVCGGRDAGFCSWFCRGRPVATAAARTTTVIAATIFFDFIIELLLL